MTQAAVQEFIDSSVSKTINLPVEISFDAFKDVYQQAYDLGCKGCTTYRPNPVTGAVLEATESEAADHAMAPGPAEVPQTLVLEETAPLSAPEAGDVVYMTEPLHRPEILPGQTYKLRWPESDHAIYITINDILQEGPSGEGRRRPFEIFINSKNMEHYAWTLALTRMISAVFRRGGDVSFVVEELKAVFDPRGGAWMDGHYIPSLLAAIGAVIERHMVDIDFLPSPRSTETQSDAVSERQIAQQSGQPRLLKALRQCPKCGAASLTHQEGCDTCNSCGYSKCV